MASLSRSLAISLFERYVLIVLQLASYFVLARLLTPADIGLFSVATAAVGIAHLIRDFGVNSYLIQEKDLDDTRIRAAFTVNLIVSISSFVLVVAAAIPVAHFYHDARLRDVLYFLSINFLLIPFNSTTMAMLRRQMRFGVLAKMNLTAGIIGAIATLGLAWSGFGYMSLVYGSIANTVALCAAGAIYRRREFWLRPTLIGWRRVFKFGSQVTLSNVLAHIAINVNDLVVGRALGFAPVGLLSRAQGVMNLFHRDITDAIRNVAYPAFAQAYRDGHNLEGIHIRSITAITAIAWPFYGFFSLFPLECLRLLFGRQWDAAAPLVPVFCLAGAIAAIWNLSMNAVTAVGRVDLATRSELIIQPVRIVSLTICAFLFNSLMPFAIALLFVYTIQLFNAFWHKQKAIKTDWREMMLGLRASFVLTFVTLAPATMLKIALVMNGIYPHEYLLVPGAALVTGITWIATLRFMRHPTLHDPMFPASIRRRIVGNT